MNLYEYLKLPTKDKLIFCHQITPSDIKLDSDIKLINDIFINLIDSCNRFNIDLIALLNDKEFKLPSTVKILYETGEGKIISHLPSNKWELSHHKLNNLRNRVRKELENDKQRIFEESKISWSIIYPNFKIICDLMEVFKTNKLLIEYIKKSPPEPIQNKAIEIYKKCLSFRVNLTNRQKKSLVYHSTTGPYIINKEMVNDYVNEYKNWNRKIYELWNTIYYLKKDFFNNTGYDRTSWDTYIKYPSMLELKKNEIKEETDKVLALMKIGTELLEKHNAIITEEYKHNGIEMSLYVRELEISQMDELENQNEEQYCYVYTLECELFVFYVGIASNPNERFEQHIRGAYTNESHLFKSRFIKKYHDELKQKIIFEGTRRACKLFEKKYITKFNPLGNMTAGGEG